MMRLFRNISLLVLAGGLILAACRDADGPSSHRGDAQQADQAAGAQLPEKARAGSPEAHQNSVHPDSVPEGMVYIPSGSFLMGGKSDQASPDELPRRSVQVAGFFMDRTEVTNREFAAFVDATGYETVAEKPIDWEAMKTLRRTSASWLFCVFLLLPPFPPKRGLLSPKTVIQNYAQQKKHALLF